MIDTNDTARQIRRLFRPFGELLRNRRLRRDLTQEELADLIDTKQGNISSWETGKSLPSQSSMERLKAQLEIADEEVDAALLSGDEVIRALKTTTAVSAAARDALLTLYREAVRAHKQNDET